MFSNLDWSSYIISIAKAGSEKLEPSFVLSNSFFLRLLCIYKSTIQPCIKNCCPVWAGAPSCHLELIDKLQKRIFRTVDPSLDISLDPFAHHWNVASLSFSYKYYVGRCSSELAELVQVSILKGGLLVTLINCMIFLSPFLDVTRISMSTVYFLTLLGSGVPSL